jgi:Domain of unknown function (DUF4349)
MSQPDLVSQLRDARPAAPAALRERVRLIAVEAGVPPRRRITWRRAVVVLVPVAAAVAAAVVLLPGSGKPTTAPLPETQLQHTPSGAIPFAAGTPSAGVDRAAPAVPAPSGTRLQRYSATLDLRLPTPLAVSDAARRAVQIAASLSGYQQSVTLNAGGKAGYADIVLRIPRGNVRVAIRRLSALGRVTSENVSIQDLQTQVNTTDQRISRLQRQLTSLRAERQTTQIERQITALTAQIQRLQRTRASTVRTAHYSTVELQMSTPPIPAPVHHKPGPLHGLGIAFHWAWIGAVYALALGTPLAAIVAAFWLLARTVRRRREDRLLGS